MPLIGGKEGKKLQYTVVTPSDDKQLPTPIETRLWALSIAYHQMVGLLVYNLSYKKKRSEMGEENPLAHACCYASGYADFAIDHHYILTIPGRYIISLRGRYSQRL